MEWDWIDFESGILTVGKSKTKAGTGRKIPIPPQLKSMSMASAIQSPTN